MSAATDKLHRELDNRLQRFHAYRLIAVVIVSFFVSSRYQLLSTLSHSLDGLRSDSELQGMSGGVNMHSLLVRVDYSTLDDQHKQRIISAATRIVATVGSLDGESAGIDLSTLSLHEFFDEVEPWKRSMRIELPYMRQVSLPTAMLLYACVVALGLILHERLQVYRLQRLEEDAIRFEPPVRLRQYVIGHGLLGTLDNILTIAAFVYLTYVAVSMVARGMLEPLSAVLNGAAVVALGTLVIATYLRTRALIERTTLRETDDEADGPAEDAA